MKRKTIILVICLLLTALWSYAALSKAVEFTKFGHQLAMQPLPDWSIPLLKWGLPIGELGIALMLTFENTRRRGLLLSSILMTAFTLYVLFALTGAFGDIPCSCAGLISALKWKGHLVFNILFTVLSFLGLYLKGYHHKNNDNNLTKRRVIPT